MPIPFKPGFNYKIEHRIYPCNMEMKSADVYTDFYGIGLMLGGDRLITCPGKTAVSHKGNLTFIHKDLIHRTSPLSKSAYETISLKFNLTAAEQLKESIGQSLFDQLFNTVVVTISEDTQKEILDILNKMLWEYDHYDQFSDCMMKNLLFLLVITTIRKHTNQHSVEDNSSLAKVYLKSALLYIETNFASNPSLEDTANSVHVSPSYLSRLFTANLGTSYIKFLTQEKLNHAQKLLANSQLSILEVAMESGFTNSSYFCDVFRKRFEKSPLQFRKEVQENNQMIHSY